MSFSMQVVFSSSDTHGLPSHPERALAWSISLPDIKGSAGTESRRSRGGGGVRLNKGETVKR